MRPAIAMVLAVFVCWGASPSAANAQDLTAAPRTVAVSRSAEAAVQPMQAPVLGFVSIAPARPGGRRVDPGSEPVFSGTRPRLSAIVGVPGSAVVSGPLAIPASVASIHFAPGQQYAIVEMEPGEPVALAQFAGAQMLPPSELPTSLRAPDLISFSPSASAAVLFSKAESRLAVLTGLPGAPQVARQIDGADLPAGLRELAIADDGATVIAGTSDGRALLLASDRSQRLLYSVADLGGMAFVPGSTDAVVFDREGGRAVLIANAATAPAMRPLAEGLAPQTGATMLQVDSRAALISATGTKDVWRIDLRTQQVQDIRLSSALTMMQPLRAAGRYLLSAQPGQPAWVLDTSSETSTVYFVPRQMAAARVR